MMPEDSRDSADDPADDATCAPWDFGNDLPGESEMADLLDEEEGD